MIGNCERDAASEPDRADALAPAKINLALHITGQRADGYHLIDTLCVFSDFGDRLSVEAAETDSFSLDGPFAAALAGPGDNLVTRARDALRDAFGQEACRPVAMELQKNLPVAAGIGGGSSDAAAALASLAELWRLPRDDRRMAKIAVSLGADVAMCGLARPLIATGIGEELEPVGGFPALALVLVNPGVALPTGEIFNALASKENSAMEPLPADRSLASLTDWLSANRNDLQAPAMARAPAIGEAIAALNGAGARFSRMSGSGATCFGLFDSDAAADRAAQTIANRAPGWFVRAVRTGASPE